MRTSTFAMASSRAIAMFASLCCSVCTTNGYAVSPARRAKSNSAVSGRRAIPELEGARDKADAQVFIDRASSARISSVGGCVVEARGLSSMRSCASSSVTVSPRRAQASAATVPTEARADDDDVSALHFHGDYTDRRRSSCLHSSGSSPLHCCARPSLPHSPGRSVR